MITSDFLACTFPLRTSLRGLTRQWLPCYPNVQTTKPRDGHAFCPLHPRISLPGFKMADLLPSETGYCQNQPCWNSSFRIREPLVFAKRKGKRWRWSTAMAVHALCIALPSALMFCHPWQGVPVLTGLANADPGREVTGTGGSFCIS